MPAQFLSILRFINIYDRARFSERADEKNVYLFKGKKASISASVYFTLIFQGIIMLKLKYFRYINETKTDYSKQVYR